METDRMKTPQLEFGEFEEFDTPFFATFVSNNCVEFPASWLFDSKGAQNNATFCASKAEKPVKGIPSVVENVASLQSSQCSISMKQDNKDIEPVVAQSCQTKQSMKADVNALESNAVKFGVVKDVAQTFESTSSRVDLVGQQSEMLHKQVNNGAKEKDLQEKTGSVALKSNVENEKSKEVACGTYEEEIYKSVVKEDSNKNAKPESEEKSQASWASLLRKDGSSVVTAQVNGQCDATVQDAFVTKQSAKKSVDSHIKNNAELNATKKSVKSVVVVKTENDPKAALFAEKLLHTNLVYKPQAFLPRGLINISNWCYINATLQALLACPPFIQLLKSLPVVKPSERMKTSTPIMDSFLQLASEFRPMSAKRDHLSNKEVRQGVAFEPIYVYKMLTTIKSSLSERGSQEDAEEFLSCVLNGLHEEMTQLLQHYKNTTAPSKDTHSDLNSELKDESSHLNSCDGVENGNDDNMNEWEEVVKPKRNRSTITRRVDVSKTLISKIFRGELCTNVFRSSKKASVSYEPFFSLPLHVPSDHPWTLEEAMHALTGRENFVEKDSDSDACRQQTINVLPPVLILHLKRFVYNKDGGSKKIDKKIDFKADLVVGKELLSKSSKKQNLAQRSYKLFAVVYHHGEKVSGGHYTTDVFHIGMGTWLRMDDRNIWAVPQAEVTRHNSNRTPYILYYRRTDLG